MIEVIRRAPLFACTHVLFVYEREHYSELAHNLPDEVHFFTNETQASNEAARLSDDGMKCEVEEVRIVRGA